MKSHRYTRYVPDPASEVSMEDLLSALSDYLLGSGFEDQWMQFSELPSSEQTLDALKEAIEQALQANDMLDEAMREKLDQMRQEGQFDEVLEQIIQRMEQEGFVKIDRPFQNNQLSTTPGSAGDGKQQNVRFELTEKGMDFLGYKQLRDLLGS